VQEGFHQKREINAEWARVTKKFFKGGVGDGSSRGSSLVPCKGVPTSGIERAFRKKMFLKLR